MGGSRLAEQAWSAFIRSCMGEPLKLNVRQSDFEPEVPD